MVLLEKPSVKLAINILRRQKYKASYIHECIDALEIVLQVDFFHNEYN